MVRREFGPFCSSPFAEIGGNSEGSRVFLRIPDFSPSVRIPLGSNEIGQSPASKGLDGLGTDHLHPMPLYTLKVLQGNQKLQDDYIALLLKVVSIDENGQSPAAKELNRLGTEQFRPCVGLPCPPREFFTRPISGT